MKLSPTAAWGVLLLAGLLETVWAVGLKYSEGFTKPKATAATLAAMVASMWLLGIAARSLPIGTAYAVWVGIGAVGAAILGVALFHEPVTLGRALSFLLLLAGVVGLKLSTPTPA
jgi:quaternary ammonium compound-resistance protein SugE